MRVPLLRVALESRATIEQSLRLTPWILEHAAAAFVVGAVAGDDDAVVYGVGKHDAHRAVLPVERGVAGGQVDREGAEHVVGRAPALAADAGAAVGEAQRVGDALRVLQLRAEAEVARHVRLRSRLGRHLGHDLRRPVAAGRHDQTGRVGRGRRALVPAVHPGRGVQVLARALGHRGVLVHAGHAAAAHAGCGQEVLRVVGPEQSLEVRRQLAQRFVLREVADVGDALDGVQRVGRRRDLARHTFARAGAQERRPRVAPLRAVLAHRVPVAEHVVAAAFALQDLREQQIGAPAHRVVVLDCR